VGIEPTNADLYTGSVIAVVSEANPGVTCSRIARTRDGSAHTGNLRRRHSSSAAITILAIRYFAVGAFFKARVSFRCDPSILPKQLMWSTVTGLLLLSALFVILEYRLVKGKSRKKSCELLTRNFETPLAVLLIGHLL